MIDITRESLCTLRQVAERCRVHLKTIYRWMAPVDQNDQPKPALETAKIGGRRVTSLEALARFTRQSEVRQSPLPLSSPAIEERRRIDKEILKNKHGIEVT